MAINKENYYKIKEELGNKNVTLIAVSKTKTVEDIQELYNEGQRDFGENYVQELVEKHEKLPNDIQWHFIGHLQSNKVKYISPFVHLVHGVESIKLLNEIDKQARKHNRIIDVLLQVHVAQEETKFGLDENELAQIINEVKKEPKENVQIKGLMGMASFTDNEKQIRKEFKYLKSLFDQYNSLQSTSINFQILSMGMSSDYKIAIGEGSTMVRVGSLIFGERTYNKS